MKELKIGDKVRVRNYSLGYFMYLPHYLLYKRKTIGKVIGITETEEGFFRKSTSYTIHFKGMNGFIVPQYTREQLIKVIK